MDELRQRVFLHSAAASLFSPWLPATSYGLSIFLAIINGAVFGVFLGRKFPKHAVRGFKGFFTRTDVHLETIGPLCTETAGLVEVPLRLSLSWTLIILLTTYEKFCIRLLSS